jgi:hypothetical protein
MTIQNTKTQPPGSSAEPLNASSVAKALAEIARQGSNFPSPTNFVAANADPSVENVRFVQKGFTDFGRRIDANEACLIKITAPEDSRKMASEYGQLAKSVLSAMGSKCQVDGPSNLDVDPETRKLALDGIMPGKIILHAAKNQKGLEDLFGQLSFWTPMVKSFEIPKNSPPNFIWLQFGTGVHWRN